MYQIDNCINQHYKEEEMEQRGMERRTAGAESRLIIHFRWTRFVIL